MTEDQKKYIYEKLTKKIILVEKDIEYLKEATKPISPENAIGRISRMDAINNKSVAEDSLRKTLDTYGKLKEALNNINNTYFGLCQKCKKEINYKRIAFMPEIRRCMKCAK